MSTGLTIPPEFDAAPKSERIAYVEALWDRIAQDPDSLALPESHKRILDERLEAYRADPRAGRPWNEVCATLLDKLRRS